MAKILIVEDDLILNKAYVTILSKEGYEVSSAADGADALKQVEAGGFELILLDMLMPEMGGQEFMRSFKHLTGHEDTKIIVFSNMSTPENVKEAMELGAIRYLTKASLSPKELVAVIEEVLAKE